jgi:hypothetical protein
MLYKVMLEPNYVVPSKWQLIERYLNGRIVLLIEEAWETI